MLSYSDVHDIEPNSAHAFLAADAILGSPLKARNARVFDLVEVLDALSDIDEQVGTCGSRAEAPNLTSISDVPAVLIGEDPSTGLEIVSRVDFAFFNSVR